MTFAFVQVLPGYTRAEYERVLAALGEGPFPGLLVHLAGPCPDGWRIIEVWATSQDQARHEYGPLAAALRESGAHSRGGAPVVERIDVTHVLTGPSEPRS